MNNKNKTIISICMIVCIMLTGNVSYARLIGKNNNKNDWVGKINANMDKIADHFVDSVIQDSIENEKYKELDDGGLIEEEKVDEYIATVSCATVSCATISCVDKATKSDILGLK